MIRLECWRSLLFIATGCLKSLTQIWDKTFYGVVRIWLIISNWYGILITAYADIGQQFEKNSLIGRSTQWASSFFYPLEDNRQLEYWPTLQSMLPGTLTQFSSSYHFLLYFSTFPHFRWTKLNELAISSGYCNIIA